MVSKSDKPCEKVADEGHDQECKEIEDEQPYEETKYASPYEESTTTATIKEKTYEETDSAADQSLCDPIYIVPDPNEQKKAYNLHQHLTSRSANLSNGHGVSVQLASQ